MKRVLVVEDEDAIREFIVINLQMNGYETVQASNGEDAIRLFDQNGGDFQVALLDIAMPGMDGLQVCEQLRQRTSTLGIIMLTARTQESDKITGFKTGADDYVTKPFSPSELIARVDSIYRRVIMMNEKSGEASNTMTRGAFTLDMRRHVLSFEGKTVELTQIEFQMMEYFFNNPGKVIERKEMLVTVWGENYYGEDKIVDVNIRRLRMKIEKDPSEPDHITTVWGRGYKWID